MQSQATPHPPRPLIKRILISPEEPRLRAGWRLLGQTILVNVLAFFLAIPLAMLRYFNLLPSGYAVDLASQVISVISITLSVFISRRVFDKRSIISLGLKLDRFVWRDLMAGIAIPGLMMGLIYLIEWAAGWIAFTGFAWQLDGGTQALWGGLAMLAIFLLVGWNEELMSRGYHLQNLADGLNMAWAVGLSSAVFGLLHWANPHASAASTVGILSAGVFLAYAYLRTRQLWLPIGLHIGWNFFEGAVFGFPVSGMNFYSLVRTTTSGPEAFTGGPFGPEAGLVLIPALLLGVLLVYWYTRSRSSHTGLHRSKS